MTVRTAAFYPVSHSDLVLLFVLDGVKKIEIETHPLDRLPWPGRRWEVSLAGSRPHPDWGWWELESERRHKLERIDWKSSALPVSESFWLDFNMRTFNGPQGLKQRQIYIKKHTRRDFTCIISEKMSQIGSHHGGKCEPECVSISGGFPEDCRNGLKFTLVLSSLRHETLKPLCAAW